MRLLTPLEARVVAVLAEKQATVPDSYPMSLNTLVVGCNQKTARDPVMALGDDDVLAVIESLKALSLVFEGSGSRVVRFEHNLTRVLGVPSQSAALLVTLMLRGPQTVAELRINTERMHRFADVSSVEGFLDELSSREPIRVVKLPRAPGSREARWAHTLCGMPVQAASAVAGGVEQGHAAAATDITAGELMAIRAEQTRLAQNVERLERQLRTLAKALDVDLDNALDADKHKEG